MPPPSSSIPLVGFTLAAFIFAASLAVPAEPSPSSSQPSTQPTTQSATRTSPPNVGDKAPDLSLQTLDGKQINLADFLPKGPVVIVELRGWVGYQCPICNRQVGELIGDSKQILSKASQVILIYPGPEEGLTDQALGTHAQDFIAGKGLPDGFSFVTDPQMKVVNAWGLRWDKPRETAYPATFVIDKNGIVQFAKISHSHGNRATAAEVNAALDALK